MSVDVTVIILTKDEESNLPYALENVVGWAREVFVLDSGSTDRTCEIAESMGARVFYNRFENYAKQRNHALQELPIQTGWVFFLDADEYLTEELKQEILETLPHTTHNGFNLKRRFYFMGRWIRHGGYYPVEILRLFRSGMGEVKREINEHVEVEGQVGDLKNDFVDHNRKGLFAWIEKHNRYSEMEATHLLELEQDDAQPSHQLHARLFGSQAETKQWIRQNIWNPMLPPLVRPFMYYFYRYITRAGFLDGREGFIYHFLQGLWFPFLIDAKYIQKKRSQQEMNKNEQEQERTQPRFKRRNLP